ncbi:hypothetical protein TNCV_3339001 [Trichonephila clavipes]|nr:hypothetical protein TNCV_3339001 [Trichonephila clavipes]
MESMRLLITSWGILSHSSRKDLSSSWRVCGGGWRPATSLPRASQTCSIGFMSGEHASHFIRMIPSSKKKTSTRLVRCGLQLSSIKMKSSPIAAAIGLKISSYNRSEDLIPISVSSQRSISNDVDVCAPVNGDATIHQHSTPPNLTLSCTNAGLFLLPRSLQMKIRLLSG